MTAFELLALITSLAGLFSWVNHRWLRLPRSIGLLMMTMVSSLAVVALHAVGSLPDLALADTIGRLDLHELLINGVLGAVLFAGAIHLQVDDLRAEKWVVTLLATCGVLLSTAIVGGVSWLAFRALGFPMAIIDCFVFGALISPTDPIAVGAILQRAGVPQRLRVQITGESLFNDGFAVVVFLLLLEIADARSVTIGHAARLLAREVAGGLAFGALVGYVVYRMLKSVDQYQVEILLTLMLVTGGYAIAQRIQVSGPLAMVVSGLMLGNRGRAFAMSDRTQARLDDFWELVDDFLNALLFVLIGIEVLTIQLVPAFLTAGLVTIPLILLARWISIGLPIETLRWAGRAIEPGAVRILTWGGLRGAISVALALSLPRREPRDLLVAVTYIVVAFSIIVQGLTIGRLARRTA